MQEYLYHYTNIESLALILKNKTIRFNSLDKMDDKQEKMTADAKDAGKCVFISSWTDDNKESIPMWNMYASLKSGIRIKLRKNPFMLRTLDIQQLAHSMPTHKIEVESEIKPQLIPYSEMIAKGFFAIPNSFDGLLHKVEYVDEQKKLVPQIVKREDKGVAIEFSALGRCKNTHWSFQREWRYIIQIVSVDYDVTRTKEFFSKAMLSLILGEYKQPFSYYDMPIADDAFDNMVITVSPQLSAGNRVILDSLIKTYNQKAIIEESTLSGLI